MLKEKRNGIARFTALVCTFAAMFILAASTVMAAPKIKKTEYKGYGRAEVEFYGKVRYKNAKVTVKDSAGKSYTATITERDDDDLDFKFKGYKAGQTYTFTISGIRKSGETSFVKISGKFKTPKPVSGITVLEIDYDRGDREVNFEFQEAVKWKNAKVTISDGKTNYVRWIEEKDAREIEVVVKKLSIGKTYTYKITGIARKDTSKFVTVTGKFTA